MADAPRRGDGRSAQHGGPSPSANEISGSVGGNSIQVGNLHGQVHVHGAAPPPLVPRQLLPPPGHFTNRATELERLHEFRTSAVQRDSTAIVVLTGIGGVGKSSLALRYIDTVRDQFTDGHLYADLRDPTAAEPVSPGDTLFSFLLALGHRAPDIPASLGDRSALFRSATSGRSLAIVLDDARSAAQVRALLPGSGRHAVLVTARARITGLLLEGASFLEVPLLTGEEGVSLMRRLLPDSRVAADLETARRVVELCGRLPIALCAATGELVSRPERTLAQLAAGLTHDRHRLASLSRQEEISVTSAFDLSYQALEPPTARLYRLLGLHPGPDFDDRAAAALCDLPVEVAAQLLAALVDAHLLLETPARRYRFHPLLRLHAREKAELEAPPAGIGDALERLARFYLCSAVNADRTVRPYTDDHDDADLPPTAAAVRFAHRNYALAWLEHERENLAGTVDYLAEHGSPRHVGALADALWSLFTHRRYLSLWVRVDERALSAARGSTAPALRGKVLNRLGLAYLELDRVEDAAAAFAEAQDLWVEVGDERRLASSISRRGIAALRAGDEEAAETCFHEALGRYRSLGRDRHVARVLMHLAEIHRRRGSTGAALSGLEEARALLADQPDPLNQARIRMLLGEVLMAGEDPGAAYDHLAGALGEFQRIDARPEQAAAHRTLGDWHKRHGDAASARLHLGASQQVYAGIGMRDESERAGAAMPELPS